MALDSSAQQLTDLVIRAQRHCMPNFSAQLSGAQLSYAQFYLLGMLAEGEALTMGQIAQRMGHSTAAATGLVDRLQKLELVERTHSPTDRRSVLVKTTEHGSKTVAALRKEMTKTISELLVNGELQFPQQQGAASEKR